MMAFPKLRFKNAEGAEFTSWVTSFIGDECKITTGNKDTQNKIDGGKYPFFVRSQTVERINTYSKDCEAILTSGDGVGVGKNYHYINGKFDFHQRVYCLYDFSNQLLGKYLYIYFSNYFFDRVKRLSAKNSVDSVRMDMISKMEIKLPSLVEQTKIASFLSNVDEKISQLTQKLELLSQYKQGMMQKLFSQQIRFKADDGSEFGEWGEYKIFDLAIDKTLNNGVFNDQNKVGKGYKLINVLDMYIQRDIDESRLSLLDIDKKEFERNKVNYGDIFFTRSSLVKEGIAFSNVYLGVSNDITYDGHLIKLSPDLNIIEPKFLNYCLKVAYVRKQLIQGGKTATMTTIGQQEVGNTLVKIPCLEEQIRIANFLSAIDQKIDVVSKQIEQAKQWKKGLLQQMFI